MSTQQLWTADTKSNGRTFSSGRLHIRAIEPGDAAALQAGFARLSEASRYNRFHGAMRELPASLLRYLTQVDGVNHVALVAFEPGADGVEQGVAVGRFVRNRDAPTTAELAVTVLDSHQGRGIARRLLEALGDAARSRGIDAFTMSVLSGNRRARRLLASVGAIPQSSAGGVMTYYLPVAAPSAAA